MIRQYVFLFFELVRFTSSSPHHMQYFGLNPIVVKNTATKIAEYANTAVGSAIMGSLAGFTAQKAAQPAAAQAPSSPSLWRKWAPAAYAIGGAVLAGGAYYKRDDLTQGLTWATDHLKYVGNLWDEAALAKRVEDLVDIEKDHGVVFRTSVLLTYHYDCYLTLSNISDYTRSCHQILPSFSLPAHLSCFQSIKVVQKIILSQQTTESPPMKLRDTEGCSRHLQMMAIISLASPVPT